MDIKDSLPDYRNWSNADFHAAVKASNYPVACTNHVPFARSCLRLSLGHPLHDFRGLLSFVPLVSV